MKKIILLAMVMIIASYSLAFAEASFDDIQGLIKVKNYAAAEKGLEGIILNHPKSAKAYYAMSQAQAGLGNQLKAKEALDMATGLDPKLKFAGSDNVDKLKEAIVPQTDKIVAVESHTVRNVFIVLLLIGGGIAGYYFYVRKKEDEIKTVKSQYTEDPPVETVKKENYSFTSTPKGPVYTRPATPRRSYQEPVYQPAPAPVIIHNPTSNNGLVEGLILGSMIGNSSHHDHSTTVVEREVIREVPVEREYTPTRSSKVERDDSWEDKSSRSNSWNDEKSSSSSSSWSDSSSSSSSSSWDSGSSSSDSSSSSWD